MSHSHSMDEHAKWVVVSSATVMLADTLVRMALKGGWKLWHHDDPPNNPADPEVGWSRALAWAGASAAVVAVVRVAARRGAASGWHLVKGARPPL